SVSSLRMKSACPAPAGHESTGQWLTRSDCVLPPSGLSRMNEFSPVIRTAWGSTGGIGSSPSLRAFDPDVQRPFLLLEAIAAEAGLGVAQRRPRAHIELPEVLDTRQHGA